MKHWTALTKNEKGNFVFYHKWLDDDEESIFNFIDEVESRNVRIIAVYQYDIIPHVEL